MKQIFFLHSAGSQGTHEGSSDFIAWLSANLGPEYAILHPVMPTPEDPDYEPWKAQLRVELAKLQGDVILIGHSLGGAVLLKYLTEEKVEATITGLFLCATPFWGIDDDWQYEPFTLSDNFVEKLPSIPKIHLYHSKDDPSVPFAHFEHYEQMLPNVNAHRLNGDSHAFENGIPRLITDIKSL